MVYGSLWGGLVASINEPEGIPRGYTEFVESQSCFSVDGGNFEVGTYFEGEPSLCEIEDH